MNGYAFTLAGAALLALGSGALYWPDRRLLCVSDLHLGKSERMARRGGALLPPYEVMDTLARLEADIQHTSATTVVCLGDSFDDLATAHGMTDQSNAWITRLQAGRRWIWIEGNHDPGPVEFGGTHLADLKHPPLVFRHIAETGASGEVSGHYHPKARLRIKGRSLSRACFLVDDNRLILPAYGTYTGGLRTDAPILEQIMQPDAKAILTGRTPCAIPMPRS